MQPAPRSRLANRPIGTALISEGIRVFEGAVNDGINTSVSF